MAILKIDYDVPFEDFFAWIDYHSRVHFIEDILGIEFISEKRFRSKSGNAHAVLETKVELKPLEILCLQAILGSDWMREAFNLRRIRRGQRNWNILFEHEEVE